MICSQRESLYLKTRRKGRLDKWYRDWEDGVFPTIYTEKKDGVQPEFDIRTDRFEVAIDAIDKIHQYRPDIYQYLMSIKSDTPKTLS